MPRFLLVTESSPWPPIKGGRQRTNLLYRALQRCGDVDLLLLDRNEQLTENELALLRTDYGLVECVHQATPSRPCRLGRLLGGRPAAEYAPDRCFAAAFGRAVAAVHYDVVIGRYLAPVAKAGALTFTPVALDVDDVDTEFWRSRAQAPGTPWLWRWHARRMARALERLFPRMTSQCEFLWVAKAEDRQLPGLDRAVVLPNIPFPSDEVEGVDDLQEHAGSSMVLFVGALSYTANVAGVDRFLERSWPAIRAAVPEATFCIVGTRMRERDRLRWARIPGVEPRGFVEDLRPLYQCCAFTVVPTWGGSGTHIKVLESLRFARTCVLSPFAQRGYEDALRHGEAVYIAEDTDAFATGCITLLRDASLRRRLARRGQEIVNRSHSFDAFCAAVEQVMERAVRGAGAESGGEGCGA